ncbi:MAG: efflux RND transporter periplasmic adaptor subunit [Ignavibacteria bacterium]|jgi:cobalt-zinc-cadmium efflux system membrane fusion protein|nr:efflux RND transporter periplasmic adaptor subunit [Ignavibacteria bacterium]
MITNKIKINLLFIAIIALLLSCTRSEKSGDNAEVEETHSTEIELTAQQIQTVGITLGKIEMKNLNSVVRANGQLVLTPQNQADVNSLTSGIVSEISVMEGSIVHKGQTVALLENLDIVRIQENYLTAKQDAILSEQEYERQKQLDAKNAGTGKILQQAVSKYESDKARLKSLELQLNQLNIDVRNLATGKLVRNIPITAPINGVVGKIYVKTGSYADMQTTLMEITDNSQVHCDLQVFEKDFPKVKQGQSVEIGLTNQGNKSVTGTVFTVNKSFDNDSKSITIHTRINKPDNLLPGMYVSALINVGNQSVQAVPTDAIANSEGKKYIFVVASKEASATHFRKVEVLTGVTELGYIEINPLEELPEDAQIITRGAFYVMSQASGGDEE